MLRVDCYNVFASIKNWLPYMPHLNNPNHTVIVSNTDRLVSDG